MVSEDRPADVRRTDPDLNAAGRDAPTEGTRGVASIAAAVFNNAVWCDAVCQALGCDTDFVDDLWINSGTSPPFYPNAMTLARDGSDAQMRRLRHMVDAGLPPGWSVKDAFSTLVPTALGFELLFEAEWLGLPVGQGPSGNDLPAVRWERVMSEPGLEAWETVWRRASRDVGSAVPERPRVFASALLEDPDIVLLAAYRDGEIVGVVVANRSDDGSGPVAGLSNLVLPDDDGEALRAGAVAAVGSTFPDLPLVCYERGPDLEAMEALGFERLGPLRVWARPDASG